MEELSKVLYEGFDDNGDWSRVTKLTGELADPDRMIDRLKSGGCCAFKGNQRCGAELKPDNAYTMGQSSLLFLTYVAVGPIRLPGESIRDYRWMLAFFCERHQGNPVLDMTRSLRRRQEKEQKKFKEMGLSKKWFGV